MYEKKISTHKKAVSYTHLDVYKRQEYDLQHVKEELADVLVYSQNLLDKLELDADEIISMKMSQNEAKYPVEKAKGSAVKYDQL